MNLRKMSDGQLEVRLVRILDEMWIRADNLRLKRYREWQTRMEQMEWATFIIFLLGLLLVYLGTN